MGIEGPFWRAIAVFRIASLAYAAVLLVRAGGYSHPVAAWAVIAVMAVWTAVTVVAYPVVHPAAPPARHGWPLLVADLAVTAGCLLATPLAQTRADALAGTIPVTATWVAGPVLAWGVSRGRRAGAVAAAVMSGADLWLRGVPGADVASIPVNGAVLLFMAGVVVGHVAQLARRAEERMQRAVELEAIGRERERLARGIHDSVLQVLALVQRRGAEIGGEAAELGRLAGEQEAALRALVQAPAVRGEGSLDLRELLRPYGTARVTVSAPATPLVLPAETAREVRAAVGAALDNVSRHCPDGTRAWVLVEEDGQTVVVSVRDDGQGIPEGRLEQAEADGRMGVARSIRGRVADLGGTVTITSSETGTEIELTIPLARRALDRRKRV
ncbi:MacS family sensor histidine kinase [Planotetraspora sp. GP83]|uniref:MacS family sensor histidine kinase n=1 Tax=Planotetraspora sp. GP83 TaxID=3156264 RepID=UPI0035183DB8